MTTRKDQTRGQSGGKRGTSPAGVALWRRVADGLERGIADQTYPANSRLPSEVELASHYGVNRHTARRAIAALAERGIVRAERGSGTYVQPQRIPYPIKSRTRFSEIVGTAGREPSGRLIAGTTEPADAEIARRLELKPGAPVVRIDALREADRVPICIGTSWFCAQRFAEAAAVYGAKRSITKVLAHFGIRDYRRASTKITAALANAADAMRLHLEPGAAIVVVDSFDVDGDGRPVVTSRTRFAGERVAFVVEG